MRYYSTQWPITLEAVPEPAGNKVLGIHNYDSKTYCEDIGQKTWGYIDYEQPLHPEQIIDFKLLQVPSKVKAVRFIGTDSWGREVFEDENGRIWKYTEPGNMPRERHDRLFSSSTESLDGEPCWPMMPDIDYRIEPDGCDET